MAYQKMTDLTTDTVSALGEGPDKIKSIEGYYLGNRTVATSNGPSIIHVFQTATGNKGVWGTKKLNDNLGDGNRGVMTLVAYKQKVKLPGGKTQHTYDFSIDPDNTIEVGKLTAGNVTLQDEDLGNNGDDPAVEELDEETQALLAAEQAKRQARVQDILNKGNKKTK